MTDPRKAAIDARLERYAESVGDPTAAVMARFYERHPDARASFAHHSPHNPASLEAEMVGNTLYYLMSLFESPLETKIYFDTSVPHHRVALNVPPDWFRDFIELTIDEIEGATAAVDEGEARAWADLREGLVALVERNRFV